MRNLLKVCMLGFLAFGFVACDKVSDVKESISFFMTKQCENGEDKIKGCAEVEEMTVRQDTIKTQTQYKDGKKIYERHISNGTITAKRYLEQIDNKYIVLTILPEEHSETRCVSAENAIDKEEYLVCSHAEHTQWEKTYRDGKIYENCEFGGNIIVGKRYVNGVCEVRSDDIQCFSNGKRITCNEQEKQKLLSQDFGDFYKRCVRIHSWDKSYEIYSAPCREE